MNKLMKCLKQGWVWIAFGVMVAVIAAAMYGWQFGPSLSDSQGKWGEFGDFLGGVANPAFALASALLLFMTLRETRSATVRNIRLLNRALSQAKKEADTTAGQVFRAENINLLTRRLELTLDAWNLAVERTVILQVTGDPRYSARTVQDIFRDDPDGHAVRRFVAEGGYQQMGTIWRDAFLECVNLLIELNCYCKEMDQFDAKRIVSNFYRNRVTQAVIWLMEARQLSGDVGRELRMPRHLGDMSISSPSPGLS